MYGTEVNDAKLYFTEHYRNVDSIALSLRAKNLKYRHEKLKYLRQ